VLFLYPPFIDGESCRVRMGNEECGRGDGRVGKVRREEC